MQVSPTSALGAVGLDRLFLNVTEACNFRCTYCYARAATTACADPLSLHKLRSLAREASALGASSVLLSGGEPFVRPDFLDVVDAFADQGLQVSISTNGSLVDGATAKHLAKYDGLLFQVSLDGDRTSVESLAQVPGAFDHVVKGIDALCAAGHPIQLNCVLQTANYPDIPFLIRFAAERDIVLRLTLLSTEYGRAREHPDALSFDSLNRVITAVHYARKAYPNVELNIPPLLLHPDDWFAITPACGWARHMCGILADGSVTVCGLAIGHPELVVGNVLTAPLTTMWNSAPLFTQLRSHTLADISGICSECPFLSACGGSCRLSAYVAGDGFCGANALCTEYAHAVTSSDTPVDDFPSRALHLGLMSPPDAWRWNTLS